MADSTYSGDATIIDGSSASTSTASAEISGGVYNDASANLSSGTAGFIRLTQSRAMHVNLRDASGNVVGTGTQYAEDGAIGANGTGTLVVARRDDALTTLTPVENDAVGLRVNSVGALWTAISGTVPVSGTFWQATQPVSGTVSVSGSVAVTGTFWQTTQPVSAASLPLPAGAATETTLSGLSGKLPSSLGAKTSATSLSVVLASDHAAQAVTGTFWQATQPISGTVGVSGSVAVTGTFWQATQPVSGTFWQTTQPISAASLPLPSGAATESTLSAASAKLPASLGAKTSATSLSIVMASDHAAVPVTGTFWQATQPVSGTVAISGSVAVTGTFWQATQPVSLTGQYVEDAALGTTPTGILSVARRVDTLATLTPVVNDAVSLRTNSRGALWVAQDGGIDVSTMPARFGAGYAGTSLKVDLSGVNGNLVVTGGANGLLAIGGGMPHDEGAALNPVAVGARAWATAPTAVSTDGDVTHLWADRRGQLQVTLRDTSGNAVSVGGGTQYTENDALTADAGVGTLMVARRDDALSTLTPVEGDAIGARVNSRGALWVVHDGGLQVQGEVAHDAVDSGNPIKIGGIASASRSNVGSGDRVNAWFNIQGALGTFVGDKLAPADGSVNDEVVLFAADATYGRLGVQPRVFNGTTWDRIRSGGVTGMQGVGGSTAVDSAIAANPVTVGGRASAAVPAAMSADGDVVNAWLDRNGRQVMVQKASTATLSNVASSATTVTVLAANTSRTGATVMNDSTAILYLKMGATASATSFTVKMAAGAYYEVPFGYTGVLDGIWASANGSARVTEIT